jgi:hypothetical protein
MNFLPKIFPYKSLLYKTKLSKGKVVGVLRNEKAVLQEYGKKHPLKIDLSGNSKFTIREQFPSGGKGLTRLVGELKTLEKGTEITVKVIPNFLVKTISNLWKYFMSLAISLAIVTVLAGFFYSKDLFTFLWLILPSGFFIYVVALTTRKVLERQIKRLGRVLETLIQPESVEVLE